MQGNGAHCRRIKGRGSVNEKHASFSMPTDMNPLRVSYKRQPFVLSFFANQLSNVDQAGLELTLETRLASNSENQLPLLPKSWD